MPKNRGYDQYPNICQSNVCNYGQAAAYPGCPPWQPGHTMQSGSMHMSMSSLQGYIPTADSIDAHWQTQDNAPPTVPMAYANPVDHTVTHAYNNCESSTDWSMMNALEQNTLNQIYHDSQKYAKDITSHLAFQFLVDSYEVSS